MEVVQDLSALQRGQTVALTIGAFDGVHLGHAYLLRQAIQRASLHPGWRAAALTFSPHPDTVLFPDRPFIHLSTDADRIRDIGALGIDILIMLPFTRELAAIPARNFMEMLNEHLTVRELWVGQDFTLGRRAEGTVPVLKEIGLALGQEGKGMGYTVHSCAVLSIDGEVISSTRIRTHLNKGEVAEAAVLLGKFFSIHGPVVHGAARGRTLGFPTANVETPPGLAIPVNGVYATIACLRSTGEVFPSLTNVGVRPHFDNGPRTVETYLLDFERDIYDEILEIRFVNRLRDEMRFPSLEELLQQMHQDVAQGRLLLTNVI